jgi:hypothetical protein
MESVSILSAKLWILEILYYKGQYDLDLTTYRQQYSALLDSEIMALQFNEPMANNLIKTAVNLYCYFAQKYT